MAAVPQAHLVLGVYIHEFPPPPKLIALAEQLAEGGVWNSNHIYIHIHTRIQIQIHTPVNIHQGCATPPVAQGCDQLVEPWLIWSTYTYTYKYTQGCDQLVEPWLTWTWKT